MSRLSLFTAALVLIALLAPFFFPWPFALTLSILASFFFPPTAILSGVLTDVLYFSSKGVPYFTILGFVIAIAAYFVQQFVKTRIMS